MTAFCLSVKTILLRSSELENCKTSEQKPVTSTDFDLHCSGLLHRCDFFYKAKTKENKLIVLGAEINFCGLFILPGKFKFQ